MIFDTRDRVSGVAGATLTWHVGRYQVLPRRRVDADPRRMRGLPTTPRRSPPPARRTFAPHHSSLLDLPPPLGPFFAGQGRDTEELCPSLDISRPERVCRPPSPLHPPSQRLHQHHQPATNKFASRIGRHSVTAVHSQSSIGITIVPPPWEFTHSS